MEDYKTAKRNISAEMTGYALRGDVRITTVVDGKGNTYMVCYDGTINVSIIDTDVPHELARKVENHKYSTFKDAYEDVNAVTAQAEMYKKRRSALVLDMTTDSASVKFHFNEKED